MKRCPFCAEEIQDAAIKCKHCGEFLDGRLRPPPLPAAVRDGNAAVPWYYRTSFIVIMILSVGPFALPLVWFRPGLSRVWKIVLTAIVIVLTWVLTRATITSYHELKDYYKLLSEGLRL